MRSRRGAAYRKTFYFNSIFRSLVNRSRDARSNIVEHFAAMNAAAVRQKSVVYGCCGKLQLLCAVFNGFPSVVFVAAYPCAAVNVYEKARFGACVRRNREVNNLIGVAAKRNVAKIVVVLFFTQP